jgi:phosphoribosyl-AMP cyclohydrolase
MPENWLNKINWSEDGLVPVVTQETASNVVLMVAWMDREALKLTVETGKAVYWSRSRKRIWCKGEESIDSATSWWDCLSYRPAQLFLQ